MAAHAFLVAKTGNQTAIGGITKLTFDSIDYDVGGGWDPTNNRWTVGPGLYLITGYVYLDAITTVDALVDMQLRSGSGGNAIAIDRRYNRVAAGNVSACLTRKLLVTTASENFEVWAGVSAGTCAANGTAANMAFSGIKLG